MEKQVSSYVIAIIFMQSTALECFFNMFNMLSAV